MKILIFTDSRGNHKATFRDSLIFPEKLSNEYSCDLHLCPYKWTTTFDFIKLIEESKINPNTYDRIILYTGVVEFSPRNISNFKECMSDKIVFLKSFLGDHLDLKTTYETRYRNEETKSLVTIKAYENKVIPYLQQLNEKLILINTNNIVKNWEGNYIKVNPEGRPKNIDIVGKYSEKTLGKFDRLVNLLKWNDDEIKKYTVDNMHLTHAGSEYIYNEILKYLQ